ncbi:MAG: hypothetical protein ACK4Z6_07580 [Candidatus Methylomirabilales bacterium]
MGMRISIRKRSIRQCALVGLLASVGLALIPTSPPLSWGQPRWTDEQAEFATNVEKMKGHLLVSRELYAIGQAAYAAIHAAHPVQELWPLLRGPLTQASSELAGRVGALLEKPVREIDAGAPAKRYEDTVKQLVAVLDEAVRRMVPDEILRNLAFRGKVLQKLIEDAEEEYEEGVKEGKIAQIVEYQDAYGFFHRAKTLFQEMAGRLQGKDPKAAKEIESTLAIPAKGFASVMPPATPLPEEKMKEALLKISILTKEMTGTTPGRRGQGP